MNMQSTEQQKNLPQAGSLELLEEIPSPSGVLNTGFVTDIRDIIANARAQAVRSVDFQRVVMYWKLGERIVKEEQGGKERADYGSYLLRDLAKSLEPEYGSGFAIRQLERARKFYLLFPIASALRTQFNWMQYKLLISISDSDKREYYELEAASNNWNGRELERQINSLLYERLLLSNEKQAVLAVARKQRIPQEPSEIIKDPMVLEFLGLKREASYYESDIEAAIITHLQAFLLELGNGFTFVARQKRLLIEDDEFFADLVFYNRLLRCFVVVELKTHKMTHEDLGQLQMYVNYYDRYEKQPDENPTVGILLCTDKNDAVVKMTLPKDDTSILASKYLLYLPKEDELKAQITKERQLIEHELNEPQEGSKEGEK
jgi:predicted nuclease of restriction endonuclease-like (RecB) superfamily